MGSLDRAYAMVDAGWLAATRTSRADEVVMLQFTTFPMHVESGLVALRQVLEKLPANDLTWHVLGFEGVGTAPDGMTMQMFEQAVQASPEGYSIDREKLLILMSGIEQTWNCLIVGRKSGDIIMADRIKAEDFTDCRYVVQAFDNTEWSVGSMNEMTDDHSMKTIAQ